MVRWLLVIALLLGSAGGVVLGALNPDPVELNLLFWRWRASLGAVFAAGIGLGLSAGLLIGFVLRRRSGKPTTSVNTAAVRESGD